MKKLTPSRSVVVGICGLFLAIFGLWQIDSTVFAEKSGSSPESGATSRIKTAYDWLVAKGTNYGAADASDWSNNWGSMWNRIMESAAWEPDGTAEASEVVSGETFYAGNGDRTIKTGTLTLSGDATTSDVATGKTFYSNSLTKLTGTAPPAFDYSTQRLATKDDYQGTYKAEESSWTAVSGSPFAGFAALNLKTGTVKQDSRTGLWWSASSTTYPTNVFTLSADGERPTGGQAIAFCDALNTASYGDKTDWYLPTQKELMTAYINGIYSQDPTFATTSNFWSSTEVSGNPGHAWNVFLSFGSTVFNGKGNALSVRCVRRD